MEENIQLYDLLNLSIGTPQRGSVNFSALHALLLAVLKQLDIREVTTRWTYTPPGEGASGTPLEVPMEPAGSDPLVRPDSPLQKQTESVSAADGTGGLRSRIQSCEDGVAQALKLIEELQKNQQNLKEETQEVLQQQQQQQQAAVQQLETLTDVEQCCHRVDALEKAVFQQKSLETNVQSYPGPEEPSQRGTGERVQSVLKDAKQETESVTPDVLDRPVLVEPSRPPLTAPSSSPVHQQSSTPPAAPPAPLKISGEDSEAAADPDEVRTQEPSGPGRYRENGEAVRNIQSLQERLVQLEAQMVVLEKQKVDRSELLHLRQPDTCSTAPQDDWSNVMEQLQQHRALIEQLMGDRHKNMELVHEVQRAILQLQEDCEGLRETTRTLHEDNRQKQGHIQELYKTAEDLQQKKADKEMVESRMKADHSALENKVSRLQFDLATEQLNSMFHELLNKVTGQEQDWHKVIDRLSTEMECKLNRMELDSVKMQLEDRWRSIHQKLQAQSAPEQEDAAGIRKQLVERFHCLSCDRPIMKQTPGPILVTLPSFPSFPPSKSIRPWTLEQIRQQYRSERSSEAPVRSCGGNHTGIPLGQRRGGPQNPRLLSQAEVDDLMQEADIVGRDGQIYRGRFSVHHVKNAETKLPTIGSRDGKMKEKTKNCVPQRPPVSPEAEPSPLVHPQPLGARSLQSSRPASSGSGRDWPVSALGCCTSQSSISDASAADGLAERCEPLNL